MLHLILSIALAAAPPAPMVHLPAGSYQPLYGASGNATVAVASFWLDREPVTQGDFLAFVGVTPSWRRSAVGPLFADARYLSSWNADLDVGTAIDLRRPVTDVSWFAATAFCEAWGKRLPTLDEWEYAAAASETRADAARDTGFMRRLLTLYAKRPANGVLPTVGTGFQNFYGVRDLHGLAWEWTADVNEAIGPAGKSRAPSAARAPGHMASCASAAIGAADPANYPAFMRYSFRSALTSRSTIRTLGFRCAAGAAGQ